MQITLLVVFVAAAISMPALRQRLGTRVFPIAALAPTAAFIATLAVGPQVLNGRPITERVQYLPQLGLEFDFRMDALSWVLALVVTGVGALVLLYCVSYFRDTEPGLGRFAGVLTAFAGAMYGLVTADNVFLLFVFWEATSVLSYLLIGHYTDRRQSRGAALQALLVTTSGGLAMLGGLVLLQAASGTATISALVAHPPTLTDPAVITGVALVLVGVATKSAVWPFSFWLPGAMAAPTPVSAYLHAAAMVKAGVYLVLRLAPAFAPTPGWLPTLVSLGILTMLLGGWRALREHDLKLVLAGGTVAQLGLLVAVSAFGTRATTLGAVALLVAHALFKSTLFLVTGIVDHSAGTRDLRRLSGLGRRLPWLAAIATVAAASMAGLPPLIGFAAKESVLTGLLDSTDAWSRVALIGMLAGSVLTVGYACRFVWGAFARKPGVPDSAVHAEPPTFLIAPGALAAATLVAGLVPAIVELGAAAVAAQRPGHADHLALWHGFTLELGLSATTVAAGIGLFALRRPLAALQQRARLPFDGADVFLVLRRGLDRGSGAVTARTQRGSLPYYLAVILVVFIGGTSTALAVAGGVRLPGLFATPAQSIVAALSAIAAVASAVAGKRFQAVVLTGATGFGMAVLFALQGAPDLALTQALVDIVTLIAFVLVLRRLPARLGGAPGNSHPIIRAVLGIGFGLVMAAVAVTAVAARTATSVSVDWPKLAVDFGHGTNVVNVTLVDLRGWDTMGELSVLIAAATGVASLVFVSGRGDRMPELARRARRRLFVRGSAPDPESPGSGTWLLAGRTLRPEFRSILLEVVIRLTFHGLIVVSIYLLFVGHNAPGGGFAGGLVAGLALTGRYLAAGRYELAAAAPLNAGVLLGSGLLLAVGTAVVPLLFGEPALTSHYLDLDLGWFGDFTFVTSTLFDIGVYLVVVGVVLDVLRSLGAEVDRQFEEEVSA